MRKLPFARNDKKAQRFALNKGVASVFLYLLLDLTITVYYRV